MARLGVMPIENLSSSAGLDWRGRAGAAVLVYDLAGAKDVFARAVDSLSAAQSIQATRLLEAYFFEQSGRTILRATLENVSKTKALERFEIAGAESAGFLPLINDLARRLSADARVFGTNNQDAFRLYGDALNTRDSQHAEQALVAATQADPGFASGYLDRITLLTESGDREHVLPVIQAAQRARLDPIDHADLNHLAATITGDATARLQTLESLTAVTPANANIFGELGEMQFERRDFAPAVKDYRTATHLNPEAPALWNQLGYALARVQDLKGAREALAQYQALQPDDVNALDSQGEVSFFLGDFKSADDYFERAAAKNPAEFLKAAEARLMLGDLKGADELFAKHLGPAASGQKDAANYQLAQWEFLTGRRKAGVARLEKLAPASTGDLQSMEFSQLAIWKLEIGDRQAASTLADQAAAHAQGPQARAVSEACRYIASGATASSGSKIADGYALLFAQKYREALPVLQATYAEMKPSADGQIRTLLAWAYVQTGAIADAAALLDSYPLPLSSGDPLFASLIFPRYVFLRSTVLRKEGKVDEANKSYQLYLKYAGDIQLTK